MTAETVITGVLGVSGTRGPAGHLAGGGVGAGLTFGGVAAGVGRTALGLVTGSVFDTGSEIEIQSQAQAAATNGECKLFRVDRCTGQLVCVKRRRRRKRLLTCSDKADIAFLIGNLGKGDLGKSAVTAILSNCGR